jgi:hypothetical protein
MANVLCGQVVFKVFSPCFLWIQIFWSIWTPDCFFGILTSILVHETSYCFSSCIVCVYDIALPWHPVLFNVFACKGSKFCQVQTVAHLHCFSVHNYLFSWDNFSIPSGSCAKISGPVSRSTMSSTLVAQNQDLPILWFVLQILTLVLSRCPNKSFLVCKLFSTS